ncbi:MAG TPA: hypothetical protein DCP92_07815 [Nitrospiraceae bacterium]|nr:hypothetical protein [Nitrospiraceae bacterium]
MRTLSREIASLRSVAIGLSLRNIDNAAYPCTQYYVPYHLGIAKKVRLNSGAPLFLGGSAFSIFPEELIRIFGAEAGATGSERTDHAALNGQESGMVHAELFDL